MIYFCADDYGLNNIASARIKQCMDEGALNKISVFPNFESVDLEKLLNKGNVRLSLHLNLVEGKCLTEPKEIDLIADENGNFRHTFGGLLKLNVFQRKKLEEQLYKEIRAQVLFWKNILPGGMQFCIDSHQHTHMIPAVFKTLLRVLSDEKIDLEYMRIPTEPILPYVKTPSLYFSYSAVNIIKQWVLKFLGMLNKRRMTKYGIEESYFMGIIFSGKMDEKRVKKILPHYIKMSEKKGRDIEVLFHPGYLEKNEIDSTKVVFDKFYLSENRKIEFESIMKI